MAQTRTQLLMTAAELPCTATVVHTFADGWTVRHLKTRGDEHREGVLAGHCWHHNDALESGWAGSGAIAQADYLATPLAEEDPYETGDRTKSYSLRDADNIPRVSFYLDEETVWQRGWAKSGKLLLGEALGHHSSEPKPAYIERLVEWAQGLSKEVVFSARYFEGSRHLGRVELVNERLWRTRSGDGESPILDQVGLGDAGDVAAALHGWAANARPGEIRVAGGLLARA